MGINLKNAAFEGWRRENGRMGVRNHVIILPVDDLSNAACEAVANNIKGALAIPHAYGRLQFGADLDLHFRTLIGTAPKSSDEGAALSALMPRLRECIAKTSFSSMDNASARSLMAEALYRAAKRAKAG